MITVPVLGQRSSNAASENPQNEITSIWDGLNPHLIAKFYEVDHLGRMVDDIVVKAALTDEADIQMTFNWQSPFEGAGPESRAPALMGMLQSGALKPLIESIGAAAGRTVGSDIGDKIKSAAGNLDEARGRTGMTKLNSTQIFSGSAPHKISITLLFRAWRDPSAEVERPLEQFLNWAHPQKLAPEGTMLTGALSFLSGEKGLIDAMLPSFSPCMIAMSYKGRTYLPLVIESVSMPLSAPIDALGRFVQMSLQVTMSTHQSWDKSDWQATRRI